MTLQNKSIQEINDNIIGGMQSYLNESFPLLPKSFTRVLARVLSGVFVLLYKYCGFIFLQIFVKTASNDPTEINGQIVTPLKFWGDLKGVSPQKAPTQAELTITVTVNNQTGSLISGSQLTSDNGVTYITEQSVLLNASTVTIPIKAVADQAGGDGSGTIGNLEVGDTLSFANALANIDRTVTVASQVTTGADRENEDNYRQRIMDSFQKDSTGRGLCRL